MSNNQSSARSTILESMGLDGWLKSGSRKRVRSFGLFVLAALLVTAPAANSWAALTVEIMASYNLVVDSNVTAPSTYAPSAGYIGAEICNTGGAAVDNVVAYIGDYSGNTPGVFPAWDSATDPRFTVIDDVFDTGDYSLTIEADETGIADGARYIGTLDPGECRWQYWLFSYPQCVNVDSGGGVFVPQNPPCDASIAGGIKPIDDVDLDYDVWATGDSAVTVSATRDFTLRNEISAAANKIWPNTTSKVPTEYLTAIESVLGWGTLGPDGQPLNDTTPIYPGQRLITTQGIWYDLGNVGHGFDNDGDLVPDQNAWLQPIGDAALFDADCFRLMNVYGIVIVKLKTGGELLIPFQNQLYFENIPDNTGVVGLVYYQYIATSGACTANLTPYQEAASGFDNEKFSADYGLSLGLESRGFGAALPLTKSVDLDTAAPTNTLIYTVTAINNTGANLGAPEYGVPLVFRDSIPAGTTFVAGSADDTPSSNLVEPYGLAGSYTQGYTDADGNLDECTINFNVLTSSYVVLYSADLGITWSTTEPGTVTDIQWLLITTIATDGSHDGVDCVGPNAVYDDGDIETSLPAHTSASTYNTASVKFQVTVDTNPGPIVCNTAIAGFGSTTDGAETLPACTLITGNNTLSGTVFKDDGGPVPATGIYGNGAQDGNEAGIGNATDGVDVTLYYDANGDGALDGGDIEYSTTSTDANGDYSFSSLPDGAFLVVAKKWDGTASDSTDNAVDDFVTGYGNTTYNPALPLTTDQGILVMTEESTTVTLAVNIDLNGDNGTGQTLSTVDFGFAPPLRLTKAVAGNPDANTNGTTDGTPDGRADAVLGEGDFFDYTLTLKNRLPTGGVQGATGCEYTVWGSAYTNGSPANKAFFDPENAFDSTTPNRTVAYAPVVGGGLYVLTANGFGIVDQSGAITKVEALVFGYFDQALTDDVLDLTLTYNTFVETTQIGTAMIDSFIGEPSDLEPNSAISWDITDLEPNGTATPGSWDWNDNFSALDFKINPSKSAAADAKTFFLDAVGLRITTSSACEANSSSTLSPVPLQDTYDFSRLTFVSADPSASSVNTGTGVIQWDDVGPILPGSSETVTVTMKANDVAGLVTGSCGATPLACNSARTDYGTNNVYYSDGRQANDDDDKIAVDILGKAELHGTVWNDINQSGWPIEVSESGLPRVIVTLFACMRVDGVTLENSTANKTCATQVKDNYWAKITSTTTDDNGLYEFIGLDSGYYMVEVGDTDGLLASGNSAPYGMTQTAEPDDDLSATAGNADAPTQVLFNNTWGNPSITLVNLNYLTATIGTEETINAVNFGYYNTDAFIFGNVWWDIDGDAATDPGELGVSGFTVELWDDTDNNGTPDVLSATTTSDANGDYSFDGLAADDYVVVVTPPTLLAKVWKETVESTGGTGDLNNQIPITVTAGQISGSHDFGYTQIDSANIGDTVFFDFDGDGYQDATEDGIANITVWLYEDSDRDGVIDDGVDTMFGAEVTDSFGNYLFENLPAGSYIVVVDTSDPDFPSNTTATADPDLVTGTIGDFIYFDANGDGLETGDVGITGVVMNLYDDTNGNGSWDTGEELIASTTTNINGKYLFTGINAGNFLVEVDTTTLPGAGLALTTQPSALAVTLASGSDNVDTADAGYSLASNYALGGRVWNDVNNSGAQDPGEIGLPGITITVINGTGSGCPSPGCTAITDEAGFWIVTGLTSSGTYSVDVTNTDLPRGFILALGSTDPKIPLPIIAGADLMTVNFGYRFNTALGTSPTSSVSGTVFQDKNGDLAYNNGEALDGLFGNIVNLLDEDGNIIAATTASSTTGAYSFTGVFIGTYAVQVIDDLGNRYTTVFLAAASDYPNLNIIYQETIETVADDQSSVSIDGVHADLNQDFGYQRFLGSIGDTIYQDINENGTQDIGEPGIGSVTVTVELCQWTDDGDGFYEVGEESNCAGTLTASTTNDDPLTAADEGGKYLFSNLDNPDTANDWYYLVKVITGTLPGIPTLIADPSTDGIPCGDPLWTGPDVCDDWQLVQGFTDGVNYLGADFGYQISGADYAAFGDYVWIDTDGDGNDPSVDSGEPGIPYITVWLDIDNDGNFDWTDGNNNGVWDSGEGEQWVETNTEGYYVFANMADGTYEVRVLTSDADWLSSLPTTPTYEAGTASYDSHVQVTVSAGAVSAIDAGGCSGCDLNIDFGYRYAGPNALSGTICTDDSTANGYCGATDTTYTGVDSVNFESPLNGIQVGLYQWTDGGVPNDAWDSNGVLDPGDTFTFLGSTTTDSSGDYSFTSVPDNVIVVFSLSATQNLLLNTDAATTSVEDGGVSTWDFLDRTTAYNGKNVTVLVRQALDLSGDGDGTILDLDFAFDATLGGTIAFDFGDLPTGYGNTKLSDGGAQHLVTATSIYLGALSGGGVTTETDGTEDTWADADDDDGIGTPPAEFPRGTTISVTVTASADGWLAGWIDWNLDGSLDDADEFFVNQPVLQGDNTVSFSVPLSLTAGTSPNFFTRFRIYPTQPLMIASSGAALDATFQLMEGEVEDYLWNPGITAAIVTSFTARQVGGSVALQWSTASEVGTVGFYLRRWDTITDSYVTVNPQILPALMGSPQGGNYSFIDENARLGVTYHYELIEIATRGNQQSFGPFAVNSDQPLTENSVGLMNAKYDTIEDIFERLVAEPGIEGYSKAAYVGLNLGSESAESGHAGQTKDKGNGKPVVGAKIAVGDTGLYFLSLKDIRETAGLEIKPQWIDSNMNLFSITNLGEPVAFRAAPDLSGIYFFGQAVNSIFAKDNVYWFGESQAASPRMKVRIEHANGTAQGHETFLKTVHFEQDRYPSTALFSDPNQSFWLWDYVVAGQSSKIFNFETYGLAADGDDVALTVRFMGATDTAGADHHAEVWINGRFIAETMWDGAVSHELNVRVDPRILVDGTNDIEIVGLLDTGAPYSIFYLDSFDVSYQSLYRAHQNQLQFSTERNRSILVSGFTQKQIMLFDITDPTKPIEIEADTIRVGDGFAVSVSPKSADKTYIAVTPQSILLPESIKPDTPSDLHNRKQDGEYLVITTRDLMGTAAGLADNHTDMTSQIIDIEDIWDEFNFGIASPHALKNFLTYAWREWSTPPQYVVLAGDGSYDYMDHLGQGGNLIPTLMVNTPHGLFASDSVLGNVNTRTRSPEIAIGRLPATNNEDLMSMIEKIRARQRNSGREWISTTAILADDPDEAGNFPFDSNYLTSVLPLGTQWDRIYLSELSALEARNRLITDINQGVGLISYVGHGGLDRFATEGLLRSSDIEALTNLYRPSVMIAMTCVAGNFSHPGYPGISEQLLNWKKGGLAGIWSPTGMSENDLAIVLAAEFLAEAYHESNPRIGDVILAATETYAEAGYPGFMLDIYTLLGDPAMRMR